MRKLKWMHWLLLAFVALAIPMAASAQVSVGISVRIGPPALPVYAQPICPGPRYIWAPGYWAWGPDGYFWVPGTWVFAPRPGFLWTPGYWGFVNGFYLWHAGYWGPHVGYYGGIHYGFGYVGVGYVGGYWAHGAFFYNTAVNHVNVTVIHNTYNKTVVVNENNHYSFNGSGGVERPENRDEMRYDHEQHLQSTAAQTQHEHMASTNRSLLASENHGRPQIAATQRPRQFDRHEMSAGRQGRNQENFNRNQNRENRNANRQQKQKKQHPERERGPRGLFK